MQPLEIRPFSDEFVDDAGALLAARHRAHRAAEPLLPERYENPSAAAAEVEALWRAEHASGGVALRGGRAVGFLIGTRKPDDAWGANAWVENAAHAAEDGEDLRDLYAAVAERWVDEDRMRHYAVVPASDAALVDAWSRLGFAPQQAYGIREVPEAAWPHDARPARPADVDELLELAPTLTRHQEQSPVFAPAAAHEQDEDEQRRELLEEIESEEVGELVAERDGRIVGAFVVVPVTHSPTHVALARPDDAALIGWAATRPGVRGSGAGLALTQAAFAWARGRGHGTIVADWRVTNLAASRFWPARGFRMSFVRFYRSIP